MAKFTSSTYRRAPLNTLAACDSIGVVKGFDKSDSFAEFQAKIVAQGAISPADIVTTEDTANDRDAITIAAKSLNRTGTSLVTDDTGVAHWDSAGEVVHLVLDNTDIAITTNNPTINKPASVHYLNTVV